MRTVAWCRITLGVIIIVAAATFASVEGLGADCKVCVDQSAPSQSNCDLLGYSQVHKEDGTTSNGWNMEHEGAGWYCGSCEGHSRCPSGEGGGGGIGFDTPLEEEEFASDLVRGDFTRLEMLLRSGTTFLRVDDSAARVERLDCAGAVVASYPVDPAAVLLLL